MEEQTAVLRGTKQKKLTNRNLYSFSIGTIGRDLACSGLFGGQILNYVYFTKTLDSAQLVVLTILMTAAKIFDALNDPLMGNIIDATHTRWGKFKPWIFIGMLGSSCVVIASFANDLNGWGYVAFFGAMYFLYSIVFTMNDIGYWGMIPSLAHNPSDRNKLTAFTAFCANIGGGLCAICVPILTTGSLALSGSAITAYKYLGVIFVVAFIVLQSVTLIGVKEDKSVFVPEQKEKIGVRQIANIFKRNDQLRWITLTFFLTQLLPSAATTMFIYFQYGYEGSLVTLFYLFAGIATVVINLIFPYLAKRYSRGKIMKIGLISQIIGNALIIIFALAVPKGLFAFTIPFFNATVTLQFMLLSVANFFTGFAGTAYYMVLMICIANTVEYNDLKCGKRDEGIIFSTRAFLVKFGGAFTTLFIMLFYVIIGLNTETDAISKLEQKAAMGKISPENKLFQINEIISNVSDGKILAILLLITIMPVLLFIGAYTVYKKKYIIDEKYYEQLLKDIDARDSKRGKSE